MKDNHLTRSFGETAFGQADVPRKIGHTAFARAQDPDARRPPGRAARRSWKSRRKTKWRPA